MFFWILSSLWTGTCVLVYVMPQKTGLFGLDKYQFLWLLPVWAMGEVSMFHWFKRRKSEKIVQQAVSDHPFVPVKGFVPQAMPSQGKSMMYIPTPAVSAPMTQNPSFNEDLQIQSSKEAIVAEEQSSATLELEKQAVETITKLAEAKGLTAFPHVLLENVMIPLTVSADIKALLITFLSYSGSWKVEMKGPVSETVWTNAIASTPLLKKVLAAKENLLKMESEAEVIPVIVLLDGQIEQEQQVKEFMDKNNMRLVRLNVQENSSLPDVSQLLDKEFEDVQMQNEVPSEGEQNV